MIARAGARSKGFRLSKKEIRLRALENQVKRLERRLVEWRKVSDRYGWLRLVLFGVGVAVGIGGFYLAGWWLCLTGVALMLVIFNVVAYFHRRVERGLTRHKIWLHLKSTQIARMKLDWEHIPGPTSLPTPPEHPFQTDLDLTGPRSIHQLLDTSTTRDGSLRLSEWLLNTSPDAARIAQRQTLVRELAPLAIFRDKLTLASTLAARDYSEQWEGQKLLAWLNRHPLRQSLGWPLLGLAVLSGLNIVLFTLNQFGISPVPGLILFTLPIYIILYVIMSRNIGGLFHEAFALRDGLRRLSAVLGFLESYRYGPHNNLKRLCEPVLDRQHRPSVQLRKVARVAASATLQRNQILWFLVNLVVPWDFYFAWRLEQYKAEVTARLPGWLEVWFELEALGSLANFSYLNPEYVFPEVQPENPAVFRAEGLGHPLISDQARVSNDFALEKPNEIIIITGSNMAGKSSFLRTLGVNLALAYAGGPVSATRLETGLFRLFSCIKVSDSVTDGYSYFYAEVRRLKALLVELERPDPRPLFFLIDEIFKGTNNRERLAGSRSYLRALAGRNCTGAVSTHDLDLVKLADELPQVKNYHFREDVQNGQMIFDYTLRPGPCPTTNALKIMRLEGLPVDEEWGSGGRGNSGLRTED